jgi:hypothetical protein
VGFKEAKKGVLAALANGTYQHEVRFQIDVKNELSTGGVTAGDLARVIQKCNGTHHSMSPHHNDASTIVHVLKRDGWYIKFYFLGQDTWFISVHT